MFLAGLLFFNGMRNLLLSSLLLCIINTSCAQVKAIKQAKAYYYIRTPGNIPVDEKRNPIERKPDTVLNVYIEVNGKLPQWTKAWQKNHTYSITENSLQDSEIIIGKKLNSDEDIRMKKNKAHRLIVLELQSTRIEPAPQQLKNSEILLQGTLNGKSFFYKIKNAVEIASPEFM